MNKLESQSLYEEIKPAKIILRNRFLRVRYARGKAYKLFIPFLIHYRKSTGWRFQFRIHRLEMVFDRIRKEDWKR